LPWQRPFDSQSRLCLYRIAWPRKPTPRIKLRVASYHATKVIAHQTPKPVIANCIPKLVAVTTSLSTYGPPSNTWFLWPIWAHNPNAIPIGSAVLAQTTVECPYTLQWDAHSPPKFAPSHGGIWTPSNTWFPGPTQVLNPNSSSIGAAVFAGLTSVTDRPTDHTTRSVRIGRIYVRSTAMQPKKFDLTATIQPFQVQQSAQIRQTGRVTISRSELCTVKVVRTVTTTAVI